MCSSDLFPLVARNYLTNYKEAAYKATHKEQAIAQATGAETKAEEPITGKVISAPMPGNIYKILVQPGDIITKGQSVIILEAMKMENNITSDYAGKVKRLFIKENAAVPADAPLVEIEE